MSIAYGEKSSFETIILIEESTNSKAVLCPERGGILLELTLNGKEILYLNEETFADSSKNIRGGVPILFPICGPSKDARFPLKQHGFARDKSWAVEEEGDNFVTLCLEDDAETLAVYPYEFCLSFTYLLEDGKLKIHQQYENHSKQIMPFYAGFHPYFLGDHEATEYLLPTLPTGGDIGHSIYFRELAEQSAIFRTNNQQIILSFSGEFPLLVLWSESPEKYICLEPWMADSFEQGISLGAGHICVSWVTIANKE